MVEVENNSRPRYKNRIRKNERGISCLDIVEKEANKIIINAIPLEPKSPLGIRHAFIAPVTKAVTRIITKSTKEP